MGNGMNVNGEEYAITGINSVVNEINKIRGMYNSDKSYLKRTFQNINSINASHTMDILNDLASNNGSNSLKRAEELYNNVSKIMSSTNSVVFHSGREVGRRFTDTYLAIKNLDMARASINDCIDTIREKVTSYNKNLDEIKTRVNKD